MEIARIIDESLHQYYVIERGEEVPNWRYIKDQDWWIEYLKSLGVQTFDDIIDESYDSEKDPSLRLLKIAHIVKEFCTISIEDIKDYYRKNENKFEHNANVFYNIQQKELERLKQKVRK